MKKLRIVFMGTTNFGVPALEKLVNSKYEVVAVIAQPDRPNKRGKKIMALPLKTKAIELGLKVLQPENIKDPEFVKKLKSYKADVFIVAAYGQILSEAILFMPKYGSLNIHGSLLPKYRGAAPIQWAVINGEEKSGVTIMQMDLGMDTGNMLSKAELPITAETTFETLHNDLSFLGSNLLLKTLDDLVLGKLNPVVQNEVEATYAPKIQKDTGHISWALTSHEILALINGTDPQPGAYFIYDNEKIKCFKPEIVPWFGTETPGTLIRASGQDGLWVKTGDDALNIREIQAPGKKRMEAKVYLRGNSLEMGMLLK
ncbi:MAG: methionyl-tRNA formyltransferase [Eubacteriaceae bacterium]|nr:methionyl-tRNA formyltransferase [Eubacteriaceae bacterium]